ncbi:hypothetical protein [Haloplanus halobius]|uniref:hypothetical protein n=1 Tax=Haloplanus halobius TaxID=2934938 RepID=UPI00200E3E9C|nr:hypothetical protein [Haloplanus sp. XH21]
MIGYYDLVLVLVPVTLVGITGGLGAVGVGFMAALPVGGAVASLVVGHALFVNAPASQPSVAATHASTTAPPTGAD